MKKVKRLFSQFAPTKYSLTLAVNKTELKFDGSVVIEGFKKRPSKRITLHQNGLKILSAEIIKQDKKAPETIVVSRIAHQNSFSEVRIHSASTLYPGKYRVILRFSGKINKSLTGMYQSDYKIKEEAKSLIVTQFESHHARETFPCIDEPEAKAIFLLSLITQECETVISNDDILSQQPIENIAAAEALGKSSLPFKVKDKLIETKFNPSPVMSSYLLAWIIGDLSFKEKKTKNGVLVRAFATSENVDFVDFALDTAVDCLDFYESYFEIPYPLPKCDIVALPDFSSGAMENWGLITFRESCMLVDSNNTSLHSKQYVALVVAHELAHQWFGNLVTMRWWTDLWLNEGFASWIEYLAVDKLFPNWDIWTQYIVDEQQSAFRQDALENTHPVEVTVNHPDEIRSIFDAISYQKGGSIIHMLCQYLGPEIFRKGLVGYLQKHCYGNTDTSDLWKAFELVSDKPVTEFMKAWTSKPGFPILKVDQQKGKIAINQERFIFNTNRHNNPLFNTQTWPIPLLSVPEIKPDMITKQIFTITTLANAPTYKFNNMDSGFYRIIYNESAYKFFADNILKQKEDPLSRLGLLSDLFEAAKAGYISTIQALKMLASYCLEDNLAVWNVIATGIGDIRRVMDDDQTYENIKPLLRNISKNEYERLGWQENKNDSYNDRLLRPLILGIASASENLDAVRYARELFEKATRPEDIPPNIRGVVYGTIVRTGGETEYETLLKWHNETNSADERINLCAALTGFKQSQLIERSLNLIDSKFVRIQDCGYWIAYSFMNRHAKLLSWEWMNKEWDWIKSSQGSDLSFFRLPVYSARSFSDLDFLKEYKLFFEKHTEPSLERSIQQGIEQIEWQMQWKKRDHLLILDYFKNF